MRHFSRFSRSGPLHPARHFRHRSAVFPSHLQNLFPGILPDVRQNLKRYYGAGHLHFITCSCYGRKPFLGSARRRDLFLMVLEQVRKSYAFVIVGYVVMPEHIHLLIRRVGHIPGTITLWI